MRSRPLAAGLLGLEGLAAAGAGVAFLVAAVAGHPSDAGVAATLGVLLVVFGAGILLVARGVSRGRPAAQTPSFLVQFFALVVAWYQRGTLPAVSIVLAVVAVGTGGVLLRLATQEDGAPGGE